VSIVSIKVNNLPVEPCFYFENPLDSSLPLIVKNENEVVVNASRNGLNVYFEKSGDFYNMHYSDELVENELSDTGPCSVLLVGDYSTGFAKSYEVVPYSKLINLKNNYNDDYEQLKQELRIKDDFYISITNSPEIIFEEAKPKPQGVEILAKDVPILILKENADLNFDKMNLQVWG